MRTPKPLPLLLLICLMAGCASRGFNGSFVGELPPGKAVEAIASDAAAQIADIYPPGHSAVFVLVPEKDDFTPAFENALRQSGFTVLASPAENAVAVAYVLDQLNWKKSDEKVWYLQLRLSDNESGGIAFARTYTATGNPEAGRSRTDIAFSRSVASGIADKASRKAGKVYDQSVEYLTE